MSIVTNGRYRCRGQDCIVLKETADGLVQVKWIGINNGTTVFVLRDEVEGLEPLPEPPMATVIDDSPVCSCSAETKRENKAVVDPELGMYVCGACGKPSRQALEKAAAREGIVW